MPKGDLVAEYVREALADWPPANGEPIFAKRMFGGHGIYCGSLMFALIADDELYLKTDELNRPDFERRSLPPFTFTSKRGTSTMSYYLAPPEAMERPADLEPWARSALEAARRAPTRKKPKRKKVDP